MNDSENDDDALRVEKTSKNNENSDKENFEYFGLNNTEENQFFTLIPDLPGMQRLKNVLIAECIRLEIK